MFDAMGKPFFAALARAAADHLGSDDDCTQALQRAARSADPETVEAAQQLLAALPDDRRDRVFATAQVALRAGPPLSAGEWPAPDRSRLH